MCLASTQNMLVVDDEGFCTLCRRVSEETMVCMGASSHMVLLLLPGGWRCICLLSNTDMWLQVMVVFVTYVVVLLVCPESQRPDLRQALHVGMVMVVVAQLVDL